MLTPSLCLLSAAIYQCRFRIFLRLPSPAALIEAFSVQYGVPAASSAETNYTTLRLHVLQLLLCERRARQKPSDADALQAEAIPL